MNVLLVNPAILFADKYSLREIPLGLAYIEDALLKNGHDCYLFDFQCYDNFNDANTKLQDVINNFCPDIVGISCNSFQVENSKKIVKFIRQHLHNVLFVIGGLHATFSPDDFNDSSIDFIVQGEGENTLVDLLLWIERKETIPKLIQANKIKENYFCNYSPNYDKYIDSNLYSPITIITSRGCLGNCKFCSSPKFWGYSIRNHSLDWLKQTLSSIAQKGIIKILFVDDHFFYLKDLEKRLSILKEFHVKYGMKFAANSRIIDFPIDKIKVIKESGIDSLSFGIEAIMLDKNLFAKTKNIEYAKRIIDCCKDHYIKIRTSWILGLPEMLDDMDLYQSMLESMIYLKPNELSIHWLVPYPGSYYFDKQMNLFNFNVCEELSYNSIPNGLYKYLNDDKIEEIINLYRKKLPQSGFSDNKDAEYYFYLPANSIEHSKRSFY
jgi:radical SAM superfamily enzyme YgiQ (UPF0313 family)